MKQHFSINSFKQQTQNKMRSEMRQINKNEECKNALHNTKIKKNN